MTIIIGFFTLGHLGGRYKDFARVGICVIRRLSSKTISLAIQNFLCASIALTSIEVPILGPSLESI
jgi:hypothetical protein